MPDAVLQTRGLTKRYGNRTVVDRLDLTVFRGDVFGFLGPNGAGKSTTIRMVLRLVFPTAGDVEIFGRSLRKEKQEVLHRVGALVENPAFYGHLSARRNLELLGGLEKRLPRGQILSHLERVGLADRADDPVKTFSHGMQQRLALALALVAEPALVVLDEPTTGLDPQGMKEVRDLIVALARTQGITVFLSSHLLHEVEMTATRMAVIHEGRLRVAGSVDALLRQGETTVLVRTDRPEEALRFLQAETRYRGASLQGDGIAVELAAAGIAELNRRLVQAGFAVEALIPQRSLERYFLSLIEGRMTPPEAPPS